MDKATVYKQETITVWNMATRLNELASEGWVYDRTLEHKPAPRYANGGVAGNAKEVVLFRRKT
jgi:hypothetical protein